MAKGRVPEIMAERHRLGQIGIEAKRIRDGACDLGHLDRVGQAGAVVIALMFDEDLRLVLEATKGRGVDDPVAVALKWRAKGRNALGVEPPAAGLGVAGIGFEHPARPHNSLRRFLWRLFLSLYRMTRNEQVM